MTNLQKFLAWNKERQRSNKVAVLILFVVYIPTYFVATQFTSNHEDAAFISFLVAIIIGGSFGPLVSRLFAWPVKNERRG